MDDYKTLNKTEFPEYILELVEEQESGEIFLNLQSESNEFIKLDLKIHIEDIEQVLNRSEWRMMQKRTSNVECLICGSSEPAMGVWQTYPNNFELISHEGCTNQLERRIRKFCKDCSVDIISRL